MTRRYPRRTKPTIASAVRRVFANCSAMVPFSPARMSELPPTATSAVFDIRIALRDSLFAVRFSLLAFSPLLLAIARLTPSGEKANRGERTAAGLAEGRRRKGGQRK